MGLRAGAAIKTILVLTLLIAGAAAVYFGFFREKPVEPEAGPSAVFLPHDDVLKMELQALPSARPFSIVVVAESPDVTQVEVDAPASTECDPALVNRIYMTCAIHRTQQHHDNKCHVVFHYQSGECAQPLR